MEVVDARRMLQRQIVASITAIRASSLEVEFACGHQVGPTGTQDGAVECVAPHARRTRTILQSA